MSDNSEHQGETTVKKVFIVIAVSLAVLAILGGMASLIAGNAKESTTNTTASNEGAAAKSDEQIETESIRDAIKSALILDRTDKGLEKIKNIKVTKNDDGFYAVVTHINSDSYQGLPILRNESADIYTAIYKNDLKVREATVHGYHQFSDRYGNLTNEKVLTTSLSHDIASKVNFDADEIDLQVTILPELWTESYTNHKDGY